MLADPDQLERMGAAGRYRAEELFGMDRFIQSYEELFHAMIARRQQAPGLVPVSI